MNVLTLIVTTTVTLTLSLIAFFVLMKMRYRRINTQNASNLHSKSAEDLLELITSVPLKEVLSDGDTVEIVICTNGHPIASRAYVVNDWQGKVKLETTNVIQG